MYRLTNDLARRRSTYPAPVPGCPAILLIDLPAGFRGPGLLLGRYYAVVIENDEETAEMEAFLDAPRAAPIRPDLLDRRPSSIRCDHVMVSRFDPPAAGWPWLSLCRWPDRSGVTPAQHRLELARACYSFEAFDAFADLERHEEAILRSLAARSPLNVRFIAGDMNRGSATMQ